MRDYQPNPELMLDSKTHSRAGTQKQPTFLALFQSRPEKVAIQLSIFPTATLTFVILI
jgi:hypothetical protein